ncbi:MAG: diphosphomevalonate decarboxylase [Deltaproteobacteria bacterium]|nr:diphosphomevalonate decarboxylase [Deltaproteobacteria bacterium]
MPDTAHVAGGRDSVMGATARAGANVALVKYWGKRSSEKNLPAVGSISLTLSGLVATARVEVDSRGARFRSRGEPVDGVAGERMTGFLDWLAERLGVEARFCTDVAATFPVGAGLASSAAIHCAVAAAASSACGARVGLRELSRLARVGSGSAARSVYGGWVEWHRGTRDDGEDSDAEQLHSEDVWPVALLVAVAEEGKKDVPSRDAMEHVTATSPLFAGWVAAQDGDLEAMRRAIAARDLRAVGTIAEENCLRMHATCLAARPPVFYWTPATLAAIQRVRELRGSGCDAYFTIDAGPQVKVVCAPQDADAVAEGLATVPGISRVLRSGAGPGVEITDGAIPWR